MGDSSSKSLCEAVAAGDLEKCQEELEDLAKKEPDEKWDVDEPDEAGRTAFQNAAYFGYESIIKLLVEHGESNVHTAELITPGGGGGLACMYWQTFEDQLLARSTVRSFAEDSTF